MARIRLFASYTGFITVLGVALILLPAMPGGALLTQLIEVTAVVAIVLAARQLPQPPLVAGLTVGAAVLHLGGALASSVSTSPAWVAVDLSCAMLLLLLVAGVTTSNVWRLTDVTVDSIVGGIAVYVLLAAAWGIAFQLLEFLVPGSFAVVVASPGWGPWEPVPGRFPRLFFFSFVTLTTLGYGDIVPANLPAGILTSLEAVIGPIYLTVLISRLVAMEVATSRQRRAGARDRPGGERG